MEQQGGLAWRGRALERAPQTPTITWPCENVGSTLAQPLGPATE